MNELKLYRPADIEKMITKRNGEVKFGENLQFVSSIEALDDNSAKYVLLGIPEDIGVRANYGKPGSSNAWNATLQSLLNIQVNRFNNPENVILLGELDCKDLMDRASLIDTSDPNYYPKLGDLVKKIDQLLADIIETLVSKNKIPIIIGGGHNNAYGNIKGSAKALNDPINVLNIDAHTDLRQLEHRHSGNGFSYAIEGQYLRKYNVFGLHKNYTPDYIFKQMDASDNFNYFIAEDLMKYPDEVGTKFQECLKIINRSNFGLELDCDAIADFPSSAKSPTGFSVNDIRNFIKTASKSENCCYFHICEASPENQNASQVGKALSYFITDFIRN